MHLFSDIIGQRSVSYSYLKWPTNVLHNNVHGDIKIGPITLNTHVSLPFFVYAIYGETCVKWYQNQNIGPQKYLKKYPNPQNNLQ